MRGGKEASPALTSHLLPKRHQQTANTDPNVGEPQHPFGKGREGSNVPAATKATSMSPRALPHSPTPQRCWEGSESNRGAAHIPRGKQPSCSIRATAQIHCGASATGGGCTGSWEEEQPLPAPHMIRCSLSIIIKTRQMYVDLVRRPRRKPAPVALFSNLAVLMEAGLAQALPNKTIPSRHQGWHSEHWGTCVVFRFQRQRGNTLTVHNVTTKTIEGQKN